MAGRAASKPQEDPGSTSVTNRKLRNRISQRAFRARQTTYIKELEERLQWATRSESDLNANLEETNKQLRLQLLDCHKRLESLRVTLKAITDSVAASVGMETSVGIDAHCSSPSVSRSHSSSEPELLPQVQGTQAQMRDASPLINPLPDHADVEIIETEELLTVARLDFPTSIPNSHLQFSTGDDLGCGENSRDGEHEDPSFSSMEEFQNFSCSSPDLSRLPSISFQQMMGPSHFRNILHSGPLLLQDHDTPIRGTNSQFSDHITACEHYLKQKYNHSAGLLSSGDSCLTTSVYFMISSFICMSWPSMTSWHTYTKSHIPVVKLTTWRVHPSPETFANLIPSWQPTQLQLSVPHPAVIDWIPFPALRDKLILCHSADPRLDEIICEIGASYVAEGDISQLVAGIGPTTGYISVWDLVRAISPDATDGFADDPFSEHNNAAPRNLFVNNAVYSPDSDSGRESTGADAQAAYPYSALPAPSVAKLFSSKVSALQAFKFLGMHKGATYFRLDPAFFQNHPELYDHKADLMASGIPIRPPKRRALPIPGQLDASVLERYRELASWTFDLSLERAFTASPAVMV